MSGKTILAIGFMALLALALFGCNDASTTDGEYQIAPIVSKQNTDTIKIAHNAKIN